VETVELVIALSVVLLLAVVAGVVGLVRRGSGRRDKARPERRPGVDHRPGVGDDTEEPRDAPGRRVDTLPPPEDLLEEPALAPAPTVETPDPVAGRLVRLRARLSRSNSALGKGLLALLSRDTVDESTWDEVEETLLLADLGTGPTTELVDRLRARVRVLGTRSTTSCSGSSTPRWTAPWPSTGMTGALPSSSSSA
jgi:fused signal recognition particle receptor